MQSGHLEGQEFQSLAQKAFTGYLLGRGALCSTFERHTGGEKKIQPGKSLPPRSTQPEAQGWGQECGPGNRPRRGTEMWG